MNDTNRVRTTDHDELVRRFELLEARAMGARWWRRIALTALVALVGVPFVANALDPVPNAFGGGDVASASDMNANFTYLQNAITQLEQRMPAACGDNQIARYDGATWVCGDDTDTNLTTDDDNLLITGGTVATAADPSYDAVGAKAVDFAVTQQWNNSNSNGVTEMSVFADNSCDETTRGRLRVWRHEDIGTSTDLADTLCLCQQYIDRTPATNETRYRWFCLYPQTDGD